MGRRAGGAGVAVGAFWWVRALRIAAAAVVVSSLVVAAPSAVWAQQDGFGDVEPGSHKPAIDALNGLGLFGGTLCGEAVFCPGDPVERSTMAVWLVRALEGDTPAAVSESRFADVDAGVWWAPYVERLAELEITVGCKQEPLRYCPDGLVTRARMASFLVRALDLEPADPAGFTDIEGGTHEANINALAAAEITVGCSKDPLRYCPDRPVTRAQMATFLARALKRQAAAVPDQPGDGWVEPYAGYVPPVHPDTEAPSWEQGTFVIGSKPPDRPRRTPSVQNWVDWCGGGQGCASLELEMVWALDYLGASEYCVVPVYYARRLAIDAQDGNWSSAPLAERLGWHRCPTVIDPRQPTVTDSELALLYPDTEVLLLVPNDTPMADRCRQVLPADVELEWAVDNKISQRRVGLDCDEWARLMEEDGLPGRFPNCFLSARLAREWLEHHHQMPNRYWRAFC